MVKTLADEIFNELKIRGSYIDQFDPKASPREHCATLDLLVETLNFTKTNLATLELQHPGTSLYLRYLFQDHYDIDMGICRLVKIWKNRRGWQYGCFLDKGRGRRIQVMCYGKIESCVREEQRRNYERRRLLR